MKHIISNFKPEPGFHCISNSLKQIFHFHGFNEITECLIFGLSAGLSFMYFDYKNSPTPFIGGRIKIGEFEANLARRLGINIVLHETGSKKKAWDELKKMIAADIPVMIYVDMGYLSYLNLPKGTHFGGHSLVVFGIDEEEGVAYISDRDGIDYKVTLNDDEEPQDFHVIPLDELEIARNSKEKPYPPKNCWLEIDFTNIKPIDSVIILEAIVDNLDALINPPINNLGISGIKLFSEKLSDWSNFDDDGLRYSAINCFFMINEVGGTGGGCFRKIYGNFLRMAAEVTGIKDLELYGAEYLKIADIWDNVGDILFKIYETTDRMLLKNAANKLQVIHIREAELSRRLREFVLNPEKK